MNKNNRNFSTSKKQINRKFFIFLKTILVIIAAMLITGIFALLNNIYPEYSLDADGILAFGLSAGTISYIYFSDSSSKDGE